MVFFFNYRKNHDIFYRKSTTILSKFCRKSRNFSNQKEQKKAFNNFFISLGQTRNICRKILPKINLTPKVTTKKKHFFNRSDEPSSIFSIIPKIRYHFFTTETILKNKKKAFFFTILNGAKRMDIKFIVTWLIT